MHISTKIHTLLASGLRDMKFSLRMTKAENWLNGIGLHCNKDSVGLHIDWLLLVMKIGEYMSMTERKKAELKVA